MKHRNPYTGKPVRIVRTPDVCGGEPCIEGRRMTTRYVWGLVHNSGRDYQYIWSIYELPRWEIDAALAYERRLHRRLSRRVDMAKRALCRRFCDCGCWDE